MYKEGRGLGSVSIISDYRSADKKKKKKGFIFFLITSISLS